MDITKYNLLTPEETADYIGCKVQTLAVWRTNKRYNLPYVKIGKVIRYPLHLINKWLADRTRYKPGSVEDFSGYSFIDENGEV